jgi:excisionase family DNA binding protein
MPIQRTQRRLLTVEDVASWTGWKPSTIRNKCWRKELPYLKLGRNIRFKQDVIERLIEGCEVPALESR